MCSSPPRLSISTAPAGRPPGPAHLPEGQWRPPLHRARLLTTGQLIGNPEDKRSLGRKHEAAAVDMESATVARMCSRKGVPFGCVRVISDRADTPLSPRPGFPAFRRPGVALARAGRPGPFAEIGRRIVVAGKADAAGGQAVGNGTGRVVDADAAGRGGLVRRLSFCSDNGTIVEEWHDSKANRDGARHLHHCRG